MKYYQISEDGLRQLLSRDSKLYALECAGVDNWDGYGDAVDSEDYIRMMEVDLSGYKEISCE